jgi:multidrug resistance protein, MATE family
MASMHYGTPSSLPSDYAILSRYANARETTNNDDDPLDDLYDPSEPSDALDNMIPIRRATRRSSFPSPYLRPLQPKLPEPFASKVAVPDEYSPLLVPRIIEERIIEEDASPSADPARSQSSAKAYRDEFFILCKYSLPVFG